MKNMMNTEMVLIDFDGVISKNAVSLILKKSYEFINRLNPIPYTAYESLFKDVISFPLNETLQLICKSFGLTDHLSELATILKKIEHHNGEALKIEDDFFTFIDFCNDNKIDYLIASSADKSCVRFAKLIDRIGDQNIYDLNGKSKASILTFRDILQEKGIHGEKTIYIEDSPLALKTAKLSNIKTIMMLNEVFTNDDYESFKEYIDQKVTTFTDIIDLMCLEKKQLSIA